MNFGILMYPGIRGKFYLTELLKENLLPSFVLLMNLNDSLASEILDLCLKNSIYYKIVATNDINDAEIKKVLKLRREKYYIFTGGGILDKEMVNLKKFIHVHPGILPEYKGSTCLYYSILTENYCGCTSFIMSEKIDQGNILLQQVFDNPQHGNIDYYYEPMIRSKLLVRTMKERKYLTPIPQQKPGKMYYIIHPVLKHIVILSLKTKKSC